MPGPWFQRRCAEVVIAAPYLVEFLGLPGWLSVAKAVLDRPNGTVRIRVEGPELPVVGGKAAVPQGQVLVTQTLDGTRLRFDSRLEVRGRSYQGRTWWVANQAAEAAAAADAALLPEHVELLYLRERLGTAEAQLAHVTGDRDDRKDEIERLRAWLELVAIGYCDPAISERMAADALAGLPAPEEPT